MEKMKMQSANLTEKNIDKIAQLFPNTITETKDENGTLKKAVNFELLKQELSEDLIEDDEYYDFNWVGKKASIVEANKPVRKTLRPCLEESKDWEKTGNLYIEGDNLEVLKLLQENYLGKIKMIYIDPPYNTGNDFIYNDSFHMKKEVYEDAIEYRDEEGNINFKQNNESNPRYHSDWCSMVYSRLKVAHNLLKDDGVIFISIDDHEVHNLRKICDEIFGEENFVALLSIETGEVFGTKAAHINKTFVKVKDYMLIFEKNKSISYCKNALYDSMSDLFDIHYSLYISEGLEKNNLTDYLSNIPWVKALFNDYNIDLTLANINLVMYLNPKFKSFINNEVSNFIYTSQPYTTKVSENVLELLNQNEIVIENDNLLYRTNTGSIRYYQSFSKSLHKTNDFTPVYSRSSARGDLWKGFHYDMRNIDDEGLMVFKNGKKPVRLLKNIIHWSNLEKSDIVLDFFSGSSTTAHAVMQLNAEDGGNRKFIMVQLPEKTDEKSEANKAEYKNICEIGKERIRRAGEKIKQELLDKSDGKFDFEGSARNPEDLDIGFRVFKVDSSNMKDVYYSANQVQQIDLDQFVSNIKDDRSDLDLLYGVVLDWGLPLSWHHRILNIEKARIHLYDENLTESNQDVGLVACFDDEISESIVREIAKLQALRVVFRDSSFVNSSDKINVVEIFKLLSPKTSIKVI